MNDAFSWLLSLDPLALVGVVFFLALTSPILVIAGIVMAVRWLVPARDEEAEIYGDWPHIEECK